MELTEIQNYPLISTTPALVQPVLKQTNTCKSLPQVAFPQLSSFNLPYTFITVTFQTQSKEMSSCCLKKKSPKNLWLNPSITHTAADSLGWPLRGSLTLHLCSRASLLRCSCTGLFRTSVIILLLLIPLHILHSHFLECGPIRSLDDRLFLTIKISNITTQAHQP